MEPEITLRQVSARRGTREGSWVLGWEIGNPGAEALTLRTARYPHGRLRSEEIDLPEAPVVEPHAACHLELEARCNEPAGAEFPNAFLILRVDWRAQPWLILARLTARIAPDGAPATVTELISAQPVGFAKDAACG